MHDMVPPRSERTVERWFNTDAGFDKDTRNADAIYFDAPEARDGTRRLHIASLDSSSWLVTLARRIGLF